MLLFRGGGYVERPEERQMTPLEFIASLPHGESKAAALTVYNLMKDECDRIDIALIRAIP